MGAPMGVGQLREVYKESCCMYDLHNNTISQTIHKPYMQRLRGGKTTEIIARKQ